MRERLSFGIYKDTVKRIFPLSLIFFAIISLISAVTVFFMTWAFEQLLGGGSAFVGNAFYVFDFYEMSPLIINFVTFGVPILVLISNSYMTRRADSDFYDSLPHTRAAISLSSMLAVLTVSFTIILLSFGVAILCGYLFADSFMIPWGGSILKLLATLVATWISVSVFSVSTAITGTSFSALAVGFLIAAGPRALMTVINSAICETSPVLLADSIIPLFDNNYNIYTALSVSNLSVVTSPAAYIYSVILAALYTFIAVVAAKKRKSESATHAAPSPLLQHIYRISIATLVCSLSLIIIFGYGFDATAVIVIVLSVIIYFLYELITTKRAKNLLGALAVFPIFLLVNLLIAGVVALGSFVEANYTPDSDDVDSVSIVLYGDDTYVKFDEYITLMSGDVELTDKDTVSLVTKALAENVEKYRDGTYAGTYLSNRSDYVNAVFKIKDGLRSEYRSVYISSADYTKIINKLAEAEEYRNLWCSLPENPDIVSAEYGMVVFDEQRARAIYNSARAEILALGYDAWSNLYYSSDYEDASLTVSFDVSIDGEDVTVYLSLPRELAETYAQAEEKLVAVMAQKKSDTLELLQEFLTDDTEAMYLMVDVVVDNDIFSAYGYRADFNDAGDAREFTDFIGSLITEEYASYADSTYLDITLVSYGSELKEASIVCKIATSTEINQQIKAMFVKYGYTYE